MVSGPHPSARPVPPGWTTPNDIEVAASNARVRRWEERKAARDGGARPLDLAELGALLAEAVGKLDGFSSDEDRLRVDDMLQEFDRCVRLGDMTTGWPEGT